MRVTYYGQACLLIEGAGKKILIDPWLTEGAYFGTWFHTHLLSDAAVTPQSICKDIDFLFLSHEHQDHVDPETLRHLPPQTPIFICKFVTRKFYRYLRRLGFTNIVEVGSGHEIVLANELSATVLGTAEYTNDAAFLIEAEGFRLLNETDCKLGYDDLRALAAKRIDIGFYMFSGANWYPMMYDYPEQEQRERVRRRRESLIRSFVQRVKLTKPRFAVPAAGPCTVLDHDRLWLNSRERGIFVDPVEAIQALSRANTPTKPLLMAATDVWDSACGLQECAPATLRIPREEYIEAAAQRMARKIKADLDSESPAGPELATLLAKRFNEMIACQTQLVRRRINAKLGIVVEGPQRGLWTLDFTSSGSTYVREGLASDWTYKLIMEDKVLWPFLTGKTEFFEDLLLSLRVRCARRPDEYNEALYHFLYEPDPEKLHNWYAKD